MTRGFTTPAGNVMCPPAALCAAFRAGSISGRKAGFTLVEVVIAMALLLLALSAFVVSFVQSGRSAAMADNQLEAIHIARDKMETVTSYLFSSTGLSIGTHNFANGFYTVSNNATAKVKDIALTVKWINPGGRVTSTVSLAGSVSSNLHQ